MEERKQPAPAGDDQGAAAPADCMRQGCGCPGNHPAQNVAEQLRELTLESLSDQEELPERSVEPVTASRRPPEVADDGLVQPPTAGRGTAGLRRE